MAHAPFLVADGSTRHAMRFSAQKINCIHRVQSWSPTRAPAPGTADLCFLTNTPFCEWQTHLAATGTQVEDGPVPRSGATGPIMSLYIRNPDGNLIEVSPPNA